MENKEKCACCGFRTIKGIFDICPVCFWQKDSFQEEHIDDNGGPNNISLREAQINFQKLGVIEERFRSQIRPPFKDELI